MCLNITSKIFATQCSFNDHLKHKIVNKTTCRKCLSPTVSTLVRELFDYYDYFLRLSEFLDLFDKVFPINFKFP